MEEKIIDEIKADLERIKQKPMPQTTQEQLNLLLFQQKLIFLHQELILKQQKNIDKLNDFTEGLLEIQNIVLNFLFEFKENIRPEFHKYLKKVSDTYDFDNNTLIQMIDLFLKLSASDQETRTTWDPIVLQGGESERKPKPKSNQ